MVHAHKELIERWIEDPSILFEPIDSRQYYYCVTIEIILRDLEGKHKFRVIEKKKVEE